MALGISQAPLTPRMPVAGSLPAGAKVIPAAQVQVARDAQDIVARATQEADRILADSRHAYELERQRGHQEGLEMARGEQARQMIEHVARSVEFLGKVEGRMVDLVMQAVRKVFDRFSDEDLVLISVRSVLSAARAEKHMILRVNPGQVEVVRSRLDPLLAGFPAVDFVEVAADARLKSDACVLESDLGLVEASMQTQLEALRAALQNTLGGSARTD